MWQDIEPTRSLIFTECLQGYLREIGEDATGNLKNAPNVLMNKILLQGKEIEGSTYEDLVKGQVAQGFTPMTWLTTQIFDAQDLPEGSLQHLLDSSEEIRPRLKEFFMEFSEVLP